MTGTVTVNRGAWLTGFLILVLIISFVGIASYFFTWQQMNMLLPAWAKYCLISIAFLRPVSVVAILFWSRSGVVLYVVLSFLAMLVLVTNGYKLSLLGIGGAALLVALVWSKWQYMCWGFSVHPVHVAQPTVQADGPAPGGPTA